MRRREFIEHVRNHFCTVVREGARHSVLKNQVTGAVSALPRYDEIDSFLARKICKDLGIEIIRKK